MSGIQRGDTELLFLRYKRLTEHQSGTKPPDEAGTCSLPLSHESLRDDTQRDKVCFLQNAAIKKQSGGVMVFFLSWSFTLVATAFASSLTSTTQQCSRSWSHFKGQRWEVQVKDSDITTTRSSIHHTDFIILTPGHAISCKKIGPF